MAGGNPSPGGPSLGTATIRVIANTTEFDYRLRRSLRNLSAAAVGVGATLAGLNFIGGSLKEAAKLETVMARIKTIMKPGEDTFLNTDSIRKASDQFGIAATDIAEASYLALSSGTAAKDVMATVAAASKLALTTNSSVIESINAITSATNAFGKAGLTAEEASDNLFRAMQFGKGSMREFSRYISNAIPILASFAGENKKVYSELAAIGALGTLKGKSPRVVFTGLKVAMQELSDTTKGGGKVFKDVMGEGFQTYVKRTGDLSGAFMKFTKLVGKENLTNIFGAKEGAAALQDLAGIPAEQVKAVVKATKNSKGITAKQFKEIEKTYGFQLNRLKQMWANTKSAFGENLLPAAMAVIKQGQKFIAAVRPTFAKIGKALGDFLNDPKTGAFFRSMIDGAKKAAAEIYNTVAPSFKQLGETLQNFNWGAVLTILKALGEGFGGTLVAALVLAVNVTKAFLDVLSPLVGFLAKFKDIIVLIGAALAVYRVQLILTAAATSLVATRAKVAAGGIALLNGALMGTALGGSGTRGKALTGLPLLLARIPGPAKIAALALVGVSLAASSMADTGTAKISTLSKTMIIAKGAAQTWRWGMDKAAQNVTSVFGLWDNKVSNSFGHFAGVAKTSMMDADAALRGFASAAEETAYRVALAANQYSMSAQQMAIDASLIQKIQNPEAFAKSGGFVPLQGPFNPDIPGQGVGSMITEKNSMDAFMDQWRSDQKIKEDMAAWNKKWKQDMADAAAESNADSAKVDKKAAEDAAKEKEKFQKAAFKSSRTLFAKIFKNPAKLTADQVGQIFSDMGTKLKDAGRKDLIKALDPYRKALLATAKDHDKVIEKLKVAKTKLKDLKDEAKDYAKSIRETVGGLGNVTQDNFYSELLGPDANKMLSNLNGAVSATQQFITVFKQLKSMGLNKTMLQQLMDEGVAGGLAAGQAILAAGQTTIDLFNVGQAQLNKGGKDLGSLAVSTFKQHGIDMAQGLVNELTAQDAMLSKAMETLGQKMAKAFKNGLGSLGLILDPTKQLSPAAAKLASQRTGDPQTVVGKTDKHGDTQISVFIDGKEFKGMIHTEVSKRDRTTKARATAGSKSGSIH